MAITLDGTNGVTTPDVEVSSGGSASAPAITVTGDTNTGIFFPAADTIAFAEGGAEAMRIDSNGALLVGTTTGLVNTTNFGTSVAFILQHSRNATAAVAQFYGSSGENRLLGTGAIQNTLNSYGAISDIKLKENIVDATPKLEKLCQVRVVNYSLKSNPDQRLLGVVAQELEQVFPGMVDNTPDEDSEGNNLGTTTKAVKYSVFVPMLIKAIQELKAINDAQASRIETLEAKVAALEANNV